MKSKTLWFILILCSLSCRPQSTTGNRTSANGNKIPVYIENFYELNSPHQGCEKFFDGDTQTEFLQGWGTVLGGHFEIRYEFPESQHVLLNKIRMYDLFGSNTTDPSKFYVITKEEAKKPGPWNKILVATFTGEKYDRWVDYEFPAVAPKYLIIEVSHPLPTEMEFYGSYDTSYVKPTLDLTSVQSVSFKQMAGVNNFSWDMADDWNFGNIPEARWSKQNYFHNFRHYIDWSELEEIDPNTGQRIYRFQWKRDFDAIYQKYKDEGKEVLACIKTIPEWILNTYPENLRNAENVPAPYGSDLLSPASYTDAAKLFFQFAARYGSKKVDSALLGNQFQGKIWPGSVNSPIIEKKTGMNLVKYIELENERDKFWKGRQAYQTARENAAYLSACYDGHKGTLGPGIGIKAADSNMKVVMGGTAANSPDYLRGIIDWCKEFRGYKPDGSVDLCFDIINYHSYSNTAWSQQYSTLPGKGLHPEVSSIYEYQLNFLKIAKESGNIPVFVTEAGYDNSPNSTQAPPAITGQTTEQTVANWILRTCLVYERAKLNKLYFYMLDNVTNDLNNGAVYATSGFINGDGSLRLNALYLKEAVAVLGNYRYQETIHHNPEVDRYTDSSDQDMYVAWMPTADNSKSIYSIGKKIKYYSLNETGVPSVKIGNNVEVTETPVFFQIEKDIITVPVIFTNVSAICNNNQVKVSWTVSSANMIKQFIVQKTNDGSLWQTLCTIQADEAVSYTCLDQNQTTKITYRIVAIDKDDKRTLSPNFTKNCGDKAINIFPNPAQKLINIELFSASNTMANIYVYHEGGALADIKQFSITEGNNSLQYSMEKIPAGSYTLMIFYDKKIEVDKIIKNRN